MLARRDDDRPVDDRRAAPALELLLEVVRERPAVDRAPGAAPVRLRLRGPVPAQLLLVPAAVRVRVLVVRRAVVERVRGATLQWRSGAGGRGWATRRASLSSFSPVDRRRNTRCTDPRARRGHAPSCVAVHGGYIVFREAPTKMQRRRRRWWSVSRKEMVDTRRIRTGIYLKRPYAGVTVGAVRRPLLHQKHPLSAHKSIQELAYPHSDRTR